MKYLLDLNDGLAPIACRNSDRALHLVRLWQMIRSSAVEDQQAALSELRAAFIEFEQIRMQLSERMTR